MPHTTSVLETDYLASQWHIARLPPSSAKRCWQCKPTHVLYAMLKLTLENMAVEERVSFYQQCEHEFWFCHDDIKRCVDGKKIKMKLLLTSL